MYKWHWAKRGTWKVGHLEHRRLQKLKGWRPAPCGERMHLRASPILWGGMGSVRCELNGGEDRVSNLYLGRANLWHYQQHLCLLTEDGPGESPNPSLRLWSSAFQLKSWVCAGDGCEPIGPALIKAVEQADCCISSGLSLLLFYLMEKSFFCFSL